MSKVVVKSQTDHLYKQEIKAGQFTISSDAPKEFGGNELAPDPHELLLSSLGACTAITMQMYAKRKNWDLQDVQIELSEKKVEDPQHPGRQISQITRDIAVKGNLTQEQLDGLKTIADKCPIHKILTGDKEINTSLKNG